MRPRTPLRILSHRAGESARDFIAAERRYVERARVVRSSPAATEVDRRRARKARDRAVAAGDRLADDLARLVDRGLFERANSIVVEVRHAVAQARRRPAGGPPGRDEIPAAHPLADPGRPYSAYGRPRFAAVELN